MTKFTTLGLSAAFALTLASAAQAQSPQIPNPANPYPANPVATDGSPLPVGTNVDRVRTGRSAFEPVGTVLDGGARVAGSVIGLVPATAEAVTGR